jgi:predicted amidohydrolase YtcJ
MTQDLLLRHVEIAGVPGLDLRIRKGRVAEIGAGLTAGGEELDGRGGALIPGLADHHIHLLALAARRRSVDLQPARDHADFDQRLRAATGPRAPGRWIRGIGYHERLAGPLDRARLDALAPDHPVRVQHQTGALWILNSAALALLPSRGDPEGLDRETGWLWRGDAWLKAVLGPEPPDLTAAGRELAAYGVTALTDASVTTDPAAAAYMAEAHRTGDLPQRLTLMSGGHLAAPADGAFVVGPVKVLLDDAALIDLDDFCARIAQARACERNVAVHCVTAAELALTLAAFESAGARAGDRIEHGGLISAAAVGEIRRLGLTVATQSAFLLERGDRYLAEVDPEEHEDLYRCASLLRVGTRVLGSSDAPYASPDPWRGMAAAIARRTASGAQIGAQERLSPSQALALYVSRPSVRVGDPADLCLLPFSLDAALEDLAAVRPFATFIAGRRVHFGDQ